MPRLIIDTRPIEVPAGTKVIEAAERLGIMIPRFCYHPALGSVGACRLCAVQFLDGPVRGLQMSCMVDALDGMVVSTTDAEAADFRRQVIEWLMLHHPHDCPVCDEGGHCLLQDHTESSGHAIRRYRGAKRTHVDQYLGPLLQHEMNRCIQCYRCTRFYQDFSGYGDLSVMQIGRNVYFGRQREGTLQSPFAGNLADVCPTGVFTDKPSRYTGRRWDYERSPSVCINCSLGCNTVVSARYRDVVRLEARYNAAVNGHFMCDRGRHGFTYASAQERPRIFRLEGRTAGEAAALQEARERLTAVTRSHGAQSVACIGSSRSSLETQGALLRLARVKGWPAPVFFDDERQAAAVQGAISQLPGLQTGMRALETADAALLVGCDPLNEGPMLAMALRQAQRQGAFIASVDPRPIELPLPFRHLALPLDRTAAWLEELTARIGDEAAAHEKPEQSDFLSDTAQALKRSRRPVVVLGTDVLDAAAAARAGALARALNSGGRKAGLFNLLPGANAFSAALLSPGTRSLAQVSEEIGQGRVKAVVLVETDPYWRTSNRQRLAEALARLELLVVMDYLEHRLYTEPHVFLPTTTVFESGGIFINQEGRAQKAWPAFAGGTPVRIDGGGGHPPRRYGQGVPGAPPLPAWHMLSILAEDGGFARACDIVAWLAAEFPPLAPLASEDELPIEGLPMALDAAGQAASGWAEPGPKVQERDPDFIDLLTGELTFGSEELSCRSPQLAGLEPPPAAILAPADAERLNVSQGDRIAIQAGAEPIEVDVQISPRTAPGTLLVPRHRRLLWRRLDRPQMRLPLQSIRKVEARPPSI